MVAMKPVLLLQSRPEPETNDDEFEAFCRFGGLGAEQVVRLQMHEPELPDIDLDDYAAVLMGGGPANLAYDDEHKSEAQRRMEPGLFALFRRIIDEDKPFLGACLGMGLMAKVLGGEVSFEYHEDIDAVMIEQTAEGLRDDMLAGLPRRFEAFVGHKEGVKTPPSGTVELARSAVCCQMLRIGKNVYATQFHPELDVRGLVLRIRTYQHHGYFQPEEIDELVTGVSHRTVTQPQKILRNFVRKYTT